LLEELRQRASEDATFAGKVIYGLSAGISASFCGGYGHFSESRLEMKPLPERGCSFATFLDASSKKKVGCEHLVIIHFPPLVKHITNIIPRHLIQRRDLPHLLLKKGQKGFFHSPQKHCIKVGISNIQPRRFASQLSTFRQRAMMEGIDVREGN
jgi:hypothetical protein